MSAPILIYQPGGGVPISIFEPGGPTVSGSGVTPLINGQSYVDVVFAAPQTDTSWILVDCSVLNTIDASPLNIWAGIITSKTTGGFRLQLNGLPDSSNYYLDWAISGVTAPPVIATTYLLSGPASGPISAPSTFTVHLPPGGTIPAPVTITPSAVGGGTFSPTSVILSSGISSATFTYTPASYGAKTISTTNSGTLTDPANLSFNVLAATYTLTGPSSGTSGVASTNFTVALPVGGVVTGTLTITPSSGGGGGSFTPSTVGLTTGAPSATFTYTPSSSGAKTISTTNNGGLTDPGSLTYTVAFDPTSIAGLKVWLKADALALADGAAVATWVDSSGSGNTASHPSGTSPTYHTGAGFPYVQFNGTTDFLQTPLPLAGGSTPQPDTLLAVLDSGWFDYIGGNRQLLAANATATIGIYAGGSVLDTTVTATSGVFHYVTAIFNGASSQAYVDGILKVSGNAGTDPLFGFYLGTDDIGGYYAGKIKEFLVYNSALGTTDRSNVELYLKTKWGL